MVFMNRVIKTILMVVIGLFVLSKVSFNEEVKPHNSFAYFIEQDDASYTKTTGDSWNVDFNNYIFSTSKSGCTNGGTLSWNFQTNMAGASLDKSDQCNIYFEKLKPDLNVTSIQVNGIQTSEIPAIGDYTVATSCTTGTSSWDYKNWTLDISNITGKTFCSITFTSNNPTNYLNNYIIGLSGSIQGDGQIVNENGYRYEGVNPNNYVLFNGEKWRIIGVFDSASHGIASTNLVKIIRDSIGGWAYDLDTSAATYYGYNNFPTSNIKSILNDYYYTGTDGTGSSVCTKTYYPDGNLTLPGNCNFTDTGLDKNARNMVQQVTWPLGAIPYTTTAMLASNAYTYERGTSVYEGNDTSVSAYIALPYLSDYVYSVLTSNCARTINGNAYSTNGCAQYSWMYSGAFTFFLTSRNNNGNIMGIANSGSASSQSVYYKEEIMPTLYLKTSTTLLSGTGSYNDPYIIGSLN